MDDREFVAATTDCADYKTLNFRLFLYDEKRFLLNTEHIDPDLNYYNNIAFVNAIYRMPSEINTL